MTGLLEKASSSRQSFRIVRPRRNVTRLASIAAHVGTAGMGAVVPPPTPSAPSPRDAGCRTHDPWRSLSAIHGVSMTVRGPLGLGLCCTCGHCTLSSTSTSPLAPSYRVTIPSFACQLSVAQRRDRVHGPDGHIVAIAPRHDEPNSVKSLQRP